MKKKIFTGIKAFALVSIISVLLSVIIMKTNQKIDTISIINDSTELPDNLSGVVFYGIRPHTLIK